MDSGLAEDDIDAVFGGPVLPDTLVVRKVSLPGWDCLPEGGGASSCHILANCAAQAEFNSRAAAMQVESAEHVLWLYDRVRSVAGARLQRTDAAPPPALLTMVESGRGMLGLREVLEAGLARPHVLRLQARGCLRRARVWATRVLVLPGIGGVHAQHHSNGVSTHAHCRESSLEGTTLPRARGSNECLAQVCPPGSPPALPLPSKQGP